MKNIKKIILLTLFIISAVLLVGEKVKAEDAVLSTSPATLSSLVGKNFNVDVNLEPSNDLVCVVKGTINFDKLSCQSITVSDGLITQTSPTCVSPNFTIGIPGCTSNLTKILSVGVKGIKAGQGNLFFSKIKVIGGGIDLTSNTKGGVYAIQNGPKIQVAVTPTVAPATNPTIAINNNPSQLFDIILTLEKALFDRRSDYLIARTQFSNFGSIPTKVNLVYKVEDNLGREVYREIGEVNVETELSLKKEFKNLNLHKGKYSLILDTTYGNNVQDEFKQNFEVKESFIVASPIFAVLIIIIFFGLVSFGFFMLKKSFKHKIIKKIQHLKSKLRKNI